MLTPFDNSLTALPTYSTQPQVAPGAMTFEQLLLYLQSLMAQSAVPGMSGGDGGGGGLMALAPASFGNTGASPMTTPGLADFLGSRGATGSPYTPVTNTSYSPNPHSYNPSTTNTAQPPVSGTLPSLSNTGQGRIAVANEILGLHESGRIDLMDHQVKGVRDQASSLHTIQQAASGASSLTSDYGHAHGSPTNLDARMLAGMRALGEKYSFGVSSITGGEHSGNSRHYDGLAFDVHSINGQPVSASHPDYQAFMADARALGATEVLGPGSAGHSGHVHLAWSREGAQNQAYTQAEIDEHQANLDRAQAALENAETPEQVADATEALTDAKEGVERARETDSKDEKAESSSPQSDKGSTDRADKGKSGDSKSDSGGGGGTSKT